MKTVSLICALLISSSVIPDQAQAQPQTRTEVQPEEQPQRAGHLCNISAVKEYRGTVNVYFDKHIYADVQNVINASDVTKTGLYQVLSNDSVVNNIDDSGEARDGATKTLYLTLAPGGSFSITGETDSSCSGSVIVRDGKLGLEQLARNNGRDAGGSYYRYSPAEPLMAGSGFATLIDSIGSTTDIILYNRNNRRESFYSFPAQIQRYAGLKALMETEAAAQIVSLVATDNEFSDDFKAIQMALGVSPFRMSASTTWTVKGANGRLLSLLSAGSIFLGGAHEQYSAKAMLWDVRQNGEIENITDLFADRMQSVRSDYCALLTAKWAALAGKTDAVDENGKYGGIWDCPSFSDLAIFFTGSQAGTFDTIHFRAAPYVAGPFSDGMIDVELAITPDMVRTLKPEYRESFHAAGIAR